MPSAAATCLLARPRAMRRSTSTSRSVSPAGRRARAGRPRLLPGGAEHGVDLVRGRSDRQSTLAEQLRRSLGRRQRRPVGTVLGHRVVRVGRGQQPGAEGERSPDAPRW